MRLHWVFLRYRDKKAFADKEVEWQSNSCEVRFVRGIPHGGSTPRIVIYFGSSTLSQGLPIETHVRSIMNGLATHFEHCTNPVLFAKHNERYAHHTDCRDAAVPSALCHGDALAIRNVFAQVSTLYLHVCTKRDLKSALDWLRQATPLLRDIYRDHGGGHSGHGREERTECDVYVCHPAMPDAVVRALKQNDAAATAAGPRILSSIPAWDVRFRKYSPYQLVPWQKAPWWDVY